jgi:hypothetical protein
VRPVSSVGEWGSLLTLAAVSGYGNEAAMNLEDM